MGSKQELLSEIQELCKQLAQLHELEQAYTKSNLDTKRFLYDSALKTDSLPEDGLNATRRMQESLLEILRGEPKAKLLSVMEANSTELKQKLQQTKQDLECKQAEIGPWKA
ncbi:MAG: hypothetical protein LBR25_09365 [Erysipelotrichaceae bacterium]|jgi:hypothetical protein|nr:hypothetical protein [Erysipelotrichaceae bacterium]